MLRRPFSKTHLMVHKSLSGQSSAGVSSASASEVAILDALTSSQRGIIATIRGAPLIPLNIRVEDTKDWRFCVWTCFALFRRLSLAWEAALECEADFDELWTIRPVVKLDQSVLFDTTPTGYLICTSAQIYEEKEVMYIPFAISFREDFVACFDLNGIFC
jgi:hypothetical protein